MANGQQGVMEQAVALGTPFLGRPIEICIVTADLRQTLAGLCRLGLGPFKIFKFSAETVVNQTFEGKPVEFELEVAFFQQPPEGMVWEVMCPQSGPTVMQEFLDQTQGKGGIHHVAFDCGDGHNAIMQTGGEAEARQEAARRRAQFESRGFKLRNGGVWKGKKGCVEFMYFDTSEAINTCFESYVFSADWEDPDDMEWFPPRK